MNIELNDDEIRILKDTINIALRVSDKVYYKKILEDNISELSRNMINKKHNDLTDNLNSVLEKLQ